MTPRVSKLVMPELVLIVNRKRLLKTVLLKIESNSIFVKVARQEVLIIVPTKLIAKI